MLSFTLKETDNVNLVSINSLIIPLLLLHLYFLFKKKKLQESGINYYFILKAIP